MFGANAQIDVPASFHVSTANELRFPDGTVFSATNPAASSLSIDQPQSFGFLGDQTAKISVVGSELRLNSGKTLSLSSGELAIDSSVLLAEAGKIQLVAIGDPATTMPIKGDLSEPAQGNLSISNSLIDVSGDGAGTILIRAGQSEINSSFLFANNVGAIDAALGKGIDIRASSLEVASSRITTNTDGQDAGNLSVTVDNQLSVVNIGGIVSETSAAGNAGNVTVNAGKLDIDGQGLVTEISSSTLPGSTGNAGNVSVTVDNQLSVVGGGQINSITFAAGHAGNVTVKAGQLDIDSQGNPVLSEITSNTFFGSTGNAGNVDVTVAGQLSVDNGVIGSNTAAGHAGNVTVNAGQLDIDGQGQFSIISSNALNESTGNAGKINVNVKGQLSILNGGAINSRIGGIGNAGRVTVNAANLLIDGQGNDRFSTAISADTLKQSSGNAEDIIVNVTEQLSIVNGGQISGSTSSTGKAGTIAVGATNISIDGKGKSPFTTGIISAAIGNNSSGGQAGNIILDAQNLSAVNGGIITIGSQPSVDATTLANIKPTQISINAKNITLTDSFITTQSLGNVPAGSITLNVADTLTLNPSVISTAANNADGGMISIRAKVIDLQDSQITTSVSGQGDGGNINLDTDVLVLDNGHIQANTNGINTQGGDIRINTKALVASHNTILTGGDTPLDFPGFNVIQAAAPDGVSGNIDITTPQLDISGDLIDLDSALLNVDDLAQNPCATTGGKQSTLVSLGRGGLPESPEQAGSIIITPERLQRLLPRSDIINDPESGSLYPETTRHKQSTIEPNTWLTWPKSDC